MSTFKVNTKYREFGFEYKSPTMFIEATTQNEAIEKAKNSALGRFSQWTFHVEPFSEKIRNKSLRKFVDSTNKNSNSQKGKIKNNCPLSRPQRRRLRRLNSCGIIVSGCRQKTNAKHW